MRIRLPHVGGDRIDDDQSGVGVAIDLDFEGFDILGQIEEPPTRCVRTLRPSSNALDEDDAGNICPRSVQPRADRVCGAVFGGEKDDRARRGCTARAVGPLVSSCDARRNVGSERALPGFGVPHEQRDLSAGDAAGPKPVDPLGVNLGESDGDGTRSSVLDRHAVFGRRCLGNEVGSRFLRTLACRSFIDHSVLLNGGIFIVV